MAFNFAARPTGHAVVASGKFRALFHDDETPSFTLTAVGGSIAAESYSIRNYYGVIVASGSVIGTTLTLSGPLPLGWYKLYLHRSTALGNPYLAAGGESLFAVIRSTSSLTARPAVGTLATPSDPRGEGMDHALRGVIGIGPHRHSVYLDDTWYTASKAAMEDGAPFARTHWTTDAARPLRQMAAFPEGTGGSAPTGTETSRITDVVQSGVANGVTYFEGRNEPNVTTGAGADYAPELAQFAATVHAADPAALVLGPCPIYVHAGPGSDNGTEWVRQVLAAGGGDDIDVISFHNYNSGDLPSMRKSMDNFVAMLTEYGQEAKPRYNTEFGSRFAAVYGSFEPRLQAQRVMFEMHLSEQYGVPKEQTSYFYDRAHGFWDFPSFFLFNQSEPSPLVPIVRVWSEELFGKAFDVQLDFGTVENDHFLGSRFTNPENGGKVTVLQSDGRAGQVTLQVVNGTLSTLEWVDPWGNVAEKAVTDGLATFDVDTLPIYVRTPPHQGAYLEPVIVDYGIEVVRAQVFSTAAANTNTADASLGINGVIGMAETTQETYLVYHGDDATAPPSWFEVTLPRSTRLDTAVVMCPDPWQQGSSLLDFELQTWNGSTWDTQATVSEPTETFQWTSHEDAGACYVDSYYSRKNCWVLEFDPVATTKVRVYATAYTYGGGATEDTTDGAGIPGSATGQTWAQHISIRQVGLYLRESARGNVRGAPVLIQA